MDRFEDLRTFLTLTQAGGFAAAAERLGIVKSAVSRRIRDIEERLDVRLLHRTSRQISLTDAGRLYESRAREILDAVSTLDDLVRTEAGGLSGPVRIAMPASFATNCFDDALLRFRASHPEIVLEVEARDGEIDMVRDAIDVALMMGPLRDSAMVSRRLSDVRRVVCASPTRLDAHGRPRTPADLASHVAIGSVGDRDEVEWSFAGGISTRLTAGLRASSHDFMREAAKAGIGVALLPIFVVADAVATGSLEIVLADFEIEPTPMHLAFPASRHVPARVRALIDHLVSHYAGCPAWGRNGQATAYLERRRAVVEPAG